MTNKTRNGFALGLVATLLLAVGVAAGYSGAGRTLGLVTETREPTDATVALANSYDYPDQLMMIYFASSRCVWCNEPDMPDLIKSAIAQVSKVADEHGLGFATLGVALDRSPDEGLSHLAHVAAFNQVSAGYGWTNVAAVDFRGLPAINATPQIVVLRRRLESNVDGAATLQTVRDMAVVARKSGYFEIREWVTDGAKLPEPALR